VVAVPDDRMTVKLKMMMVCGGDLQWRLGNTYTELMEFAGDTCGSG